jgi:hypothetical protein
MEVPHSPTYLDKYRLKEGMCRYTTHYDQRVTSGQIKIIRMGSLSDSPIPI